MTTQTHTHKNFNYITQCARKAVINILLHHHLVSKAYKDDGRALEVRKREKKQATKKILLFILVFYFW